MGERLRIDGERGVAEARCDLLASGGDPVEQLCKGNALIGICLLLVDQRPAEIGQWVGRRTRAVHDVEVR